MNFFLPRGLYSKGYAFHESLFNLNSSTSPYFLFVLSADFMWTFCGHCVEISIKVLPLVL
jgi:hypothetical protein